MSRHILERGTPRKARLKVIISLVNRATSMSNIDPQTVSSFGEEWLRFDQSGMSITEAQKAFESYFAVFPWADLRPDAEGFDMGCGSGRWARWVAPKVGRLHCIDPSIAIDVARKNLADLSNLSFERAGVDDHSLPPSSQDFGYSLGVLHHVPNTEQAIRSCAELLKPGAPLLLYLYYAFENRPWWFRTIWRLTWAGVLVRLKLICRLHRRVLTTFGHRSCDRDVLAVYHRRTSLADAKST